MVRNILKFLLLCPDGLSERKEIAWDKEHQAPLKALGAKGSASGEYEVEVTAPRAEALLKLLKQWRKERARVNGFELSEVLVDDDKTPVEWFILDPTGHNSFSDGFETFCWDLQEPVLDDDIHLKVKADRMRPGVHVTGWSPLLYVSERFKAVVEANRLAGIEFVWCRDVGKYRTPQWYLPVCHSCLGRGLDHPWIDAKTLSGVGSLTLDPRGRHGLSDAFSKHYKRDAGPSDPALKNLLALLKSMDLGKQGPDYRSFPRFLRKYLPDTDFAYTLEDTGTNDDYSRHRGLALNRKARDMLRANRVVTDDLCAPVLILDRPPRGVENLDRRYGPAEPAFSPKQLARLRQWESAAWREHLANPKPPRAPDLARSMSLLRSRKRLEPKCFRRPAAPKTIAEAAKAVGLNIPDAWQKVLRVSNGGRVDNNLLASDHACILIPVEELARSRKQEATYYHDIHAQLPDSLLVVMKTETGDSAWLDTARQQPDGDCRVVLMSHETGEAEREWPTVAEFLEELLTAEEA